MADELELDLDTEVQDEVSKSEKRIKSLSEKVKLTAQERDELAKAKADEESKRLIAEKERDFFKNFNSLASKYQGASEFQNEIWEKVKSGYTEEDATVAVVVSKGKFSPPPTEPAPKENPAGGSAVNTLKTSGEKPLSEMSREEKGAALEDAIAKGDISFH